MKLKLIAQLQKAKRILGLVVLTITVVSLGLMWMLPSVWTYPVTSGLGRFILARSTWLLPEITLPRLTWLSAIYLFVLIPLAGLKSTRKYAAWGCFLLSSSCLIILFFAGFLVSLDIVGFEWTVYGVFFFAIGHVLIALIASLLLGNWVVLSELVFLIILCGVSVAIGSKLEESSS